MIIYELIYYIEDLIDGSEITDSKLLKSEDDVKKEIERFKKENPGGIISYCADECPVPPEEQETYSCDYEDSITSFLLIKTHTI